MEPKFIKTSDKETADKLLEENFQLLTKENNVWVFINNIKNHVLFDNKKVIYTNILNF